MSLLAVHCLQQEQWRKMALLSDDGERTNEEKVGSETLSPGICQRRNKLHLGGKTKNDSCAALLICPANMISL